MTLIRFDSPLWKRQHRRAESVELDQLSDEHLSAPLDGLFSDQALNAAMGPITAWCDSQKEL